MYTMSRILTSFSLAIALFVTPFAFSEQQGESKADGPLCELVTKGLVEFKNGSLSYTQDGVDLILQLGEDFRHTEGAYNRNIEGQEDIFIAHMLAWGMGHNHLLLGGPGAAKTLGVDFLFPFLWGRQVAEWTMPEDIFGGKTEEALSKGIDEINDKGMALQSEAVLLDEINNMNPGLSSDLMSFLNAGERFIRVAGKIRKAVTRAVFSTGNASLVEILYVFLERNMQSGPAVLSRFSFKSFVSNWRETEQQARLDKLYQERDSWKFIADYGDENERRVAEEKLERETPKLINYHTMEFISRSLFEPTEEFNVALGQLMEKLREQLNIESLKSKTDGSDENFEPGSDFNERLRAQAWKVVRMSATIDFLKLDAEKQRELLKAGPIKLSAFNIWRISHLAKPTVDGKAIFNFPNLKMNFNLVKVNEHSYRPFSIQKMIDTARNVGDVKWWGFIRKEQDIFNTNLNSVLESQPQKVADIFSGGPTDVKDVNNDGTLFEKLIYEELSKKIADSLPASSN